MKKILFQIIIVWSFLCCPYHVSGENLNLEAKKQEKYEEKWKNLKEGMSEKQVVSKLGKPKLIWRSSTDCFYYYDEIPEVHVYSKDKRKTLNLIPPGGQSGASAMFGVAGGSPRGCVKFYYGVANSSKTIEGTNELRPPVTSKSKKGILVRYNMYGGGYGPRSDYYFKEIKNPEEKIYRLEKGRFPDFVNMRIGNPLSSEVWDDLSGIENKAKWQDPKSWRRLPGKVNKKMSKGPRGRVWVKQPVEDKEFFKAFTEEKIISLLGEPHIKTNSPGEMIWQYGDVYQSGELKNRITSRKTGFGRIVFVQDENGRYVLSKWSEPYWPDVIENISQPVNRVPEQQQVITNKPAKEGGPSKALPKWALKDTWLNMKTGITSDQVVAILGEPENIQSYRRVTNQHDDNETLAYYYYGLPIGSTEELKTFPSIGEIKKYGNAAVIFEEKKRRLFVKTWYEPDYDKIDHLVNYKVNNLTPKRGREKWEKIELWKKLRPNMPLRSVELLLGFPHTYHAVSDMDKIHISSTAEFFYGDVKECGILEFKIKKSKNRSNLVLIEWSEPFWLEVDKSVNGGLKYDSPYGETKDNFVDIFVKKKGWSKLSTDSKEGEVKRLLGEPLSVIKGNYAVTWLYDYIPLGENIEIDPYKSGEKPIPGTVTFVEQETIGHNFRSKKWVARKWIEPDWSNLEKRKRVLGSEDYESPFLPKYRWQRHDLWGKLKQKMELQDIEALLGSEGKRELEGVNTVIHFGDMKNYGYLRFKSTTMSQDSGDEGLSLSSWKEPYWPCVEQQVKKEAKNKIIIGNREIKQLTDNEYNDELPCVGGSNIVWQGVADKYNSIFLLNEDGVNKISSSGNNYYPLTSGSSVVWENSSGLVLYKNKKLIRLGKTKPYSYDISAERVIWADYSGINYYDGTQKRNILVGANPYNIAISDTEIAWSDGSRHSIFKTKGGDAKELSVGGNTGGKGILSIKMSGSNTVVRGEHNLYHIDISKPPRRATWPGGNVSPFWVMPESKTIKNPNRQVSNKSVKLYHLKGMYGPSINDSSTVWIGDTYDIFLFNGTETERITNNSNKNLYPKIGENCIVWQGHDGNDYEIFVYDGEMITQITNNELDDLRPSISESDKTIAWQGWDGNDFEIFTVDLQ